MLGYFCAKLYLRCFKSTIGFSRSEDFDRALVRGNGDFLELLLLPDVEELDDELDDNERCLCLLRLRFEMI